MVRTREYDFCCFPFMSGAVKLFNMDEDSSYKKSAEDADAAGSRMNVFTTVYERDI